MSVRRRSARSIFTIIAVAAAALLGLILLVFLTNRKVDREVTAAPPAPPAAPVKLTAAQRAALPRSTTWTKIPKAQPDPRPDAAGDGLLVHPTTSKIVYAEPGGAAIGLLPPTQLDDPTWLPVIESRPEWVRVLLPSRPNGSTGWIHTGDGKTKQTRSPYQVHINLTTRRLTLLKDGQENGSWTVGIGTEDTPTPVGRTFLLATLSPSDVDYSPVILPLGMHSEKLQTYDGGPGTIGIHGWPDKSVFGKAISHGCIRVPPAGLTALSKIPIGTMIVITK
ncbi:hypothetical protein Skr01_19400 [Sphaerisporangium krabiense]|uniref:Lipoprotein-anchoring transpeptidase ErfK/SrfK n=1 Tax=Sphaerisporangium krabiense TaxID=763782 RepID=A0A7W9DQQ0_9ACTN|nr:L,D-transpeptidase [Sphaerisporangium krabiense]MBB5627696.1 lipoprotein-anchoring transpeptidase ErfK/SrfK [Sphaerisporangium krabiense]GII61855.1 hypothetical protein Skr01_19400 [Sphaerisporangium krabiense]